LLGDDRETNIETTAIAKEKLHKYGTVLEPLLGRSLRTTMELLLEAVFSVWSALRLYNSTDRVHFSEFSTVEWSEELFVE
jgi:hypothetical protein